MIVPNSLIYSNITFVLANCREYKEALRQQRNRNQDSSAIYRPKDQQQATTPLSDGSPLANDSPIGTFTSNTKSLLTATKGSHAHTPTSSTHLTQAQYQSPTITPSPNAYTNGDGSNGQEINSVVSNKAYINSIDLNNGSGITSPNKNDRPVQKVIPSRNATPIKYQQPSNGNQAIGEMTAIVTKDASTYVKPNSPSVVPVAVVSTHMPLSISVDKSAKAANKANGTKPNRYVGHLSAINAIFRRWTTNDNFSSLAAFHGIVIFRRRSSALPCEENWIATKRKKN